MTATCSVLPAARWICRDRTSSSSSSYQRREKPCGGKRMDRLSVKEVASTIRIGPISTTSASTARLPMTRP